MLNNLFEAKKRLYPQNVKGRFRRLKWLLNTVFLSIYFFFPFFRFNRGEGAPNQAILIDLPGSKAYFFFIEIWPQEVYYLAGILIIAAVMLFFITSLFGRIWCGYACFQTVWTDIFIALERLFQGDRNERILLDRKKSFKKFRQKFLTHGSWIIVSLLTGYGLTCYFNDAILLTKNIFRGEINANILGWILGVAFATYIMAGFAREHVCTYMCPYSRFQSAMFDKNTLIITYDEKRGEPRGKLKPNENSNKILLKPAFSDGLEGGAQHKKEVYLNIHDRLSSAPTEQSPLKVGFERGDCIDCKQCVVVCPTGIDIRNGLQMECIACGLCIDACDNVMEKIGRPKGLIRYDTLNHLFDPIPEKKFKIFQPRSFLYSAILLSVCGLMLRNLILKPTLETSIIPDRNPIFVTLSDGSIRNGYVIKIMNKIHQKKIFSLKISTPKEAVLKLQNADLDHLEVAPDDVGSFKIYTILPKDFMANSEEGRGLIEFIVTDESNKKEQKIQASFIGR
jgi:polyferredoxin